MKWKKASTGNGTFCKVTRARSYSSVALLKPGDNI